MLRLMTAEGIKMSRFWLTWLLAGLFVLILGLQINTKLSRLEELETELMTSPQEPAEGFSAFQEVSNRYEIAMLRQNLHYPAVVGYVGRLASAYGWFFIIVFTAVMVGEEFARRTLRVVLVQGVKRRDYVLGRCVSLWLATGSMIVILALLAMITGPIVHTQVTSEPISLTGLGDALLPFLRLWLACLPFVTTMLFWTVLARHTGPALAVGLGLRFIELISILFLPPFQAIYAAQGKAVPFFVRWPSHLLSVMLGYNAEVLLHWGTPEVITQMTTGLNGDILFPINPWRAMAFLAAYTFFFLGLTVYIMQRRDVTYGA